MSRVCGERRPRPDRRIHELVEAQAAARPDAVAVVLGEETWTYRELNARANRIARSLLARGLQREDVVAVTTERTLDWAAATLAVFKAGGAYLPVEPGFPAERIGRMLDRSGCRQVLTETEIEAAYDEGRADPRADDNPGVAVAADQLAYLYFTSGSTGEPKGAMCEHAGLVNHVFAKIEDLGIGPHTVVAQTAPQCFDISLWQLVSAWVVGGTTRIVEQEVVLDAARFVDTLAEGRVEVVQVVPSYLDVLLASLAARPRPLPDLRMVSVTGEAVTSELVRRFFATVPGVGLVNAYGLTETSDDTNHEVMWAPSEGERVPVGRPLPNVEVSVVDEHLTPIPSGETGEIVFSGVCVGRGYVNDPERTAESFVDDPHRPGVRLYRSGDLGRWRPDGRLEFLGRRDSQVKVRGFRIEIGEVEAALVRVPGVGSGAVVVSGSDQRLVACYAGDDLKDATLAEHLGRSLPDYMIPAAYHRLDSLPLTDNGKVDRAALRELVAAIPDEPRSADAPRTPAERRVALAWASVLGVPLDQVGRDDHFFDRGGTSLAAVSLAIALDRAVSLKEIVGRPVLADLAHLLDDQREETR